MKERIMCKTHCIVWNDIDKDCEIYGEHHPCPRRRPYYQTHTAFQHVKEVDRMRDTLTEKEKQIERLQERLEESERFVKHDAYSERLFGFVHIDRHGAEHSTREATNYCEKYGLEPEHYSMYNLHKFKKIIYKEKIARGCGIYTNPEIQMHCLGYKIEYSDIEEIGERWLFWVDDYIEPMPEYLEKGGAKCR